MSCFFYQSLRSFCSIPLPKSSALSILGLRGNPSFQDIKKAYFLMSKRYHPDVSETSIEKFKEIAEAYNTLKNMMNNEEDRQYSFLRNSHFNSYDGRVNEDDYKAFMMNMSHFEEKKKEIHLDLNESEASIYRKLFGKSFKEDPAFFYDKKNKALREEFEAEMEKLLEKEQFTVTKDEQKNAFFRAHEHIKTETHHKDYEYKENKKRMEKMIKH